MRFEIFMLPPPVGRLTSGFFLVTTILYVHSRTRVKPQYDVHPRGREGSKYGCEEFIEVKDICMGGV
jgi:hypothetical protein